MLYCIIFYIFDPNEIKAAKIDLENILQQRAKLNHTLFGLICKKTSSVAVPSINRNSKIAKQK
ncbi:MAG: hypothetical protein MUE81_03375 [Thermoflexibacter sp.]|nr:hypothetical protein [Thermoflexibacter sp.]